MLAAFFYGCEAVEYHPYDVRISGQKDINNKNIPRIEEACRDKDTVRFVLMGDSQRWYDETEAFVKHLNKRQGIDFVIHGGDISDFGLTREFEWVRDIMSKLTVPYVALAGNHDMLGNGVDVYRKMYGDLDFSFRAGRFLFLCLNTNALEFDYSHPVPDFGFIGGVREALPESGISRTIPVMHVRPGDVEFNNNVSLIFQEVLKRFPGMEFCLHAHNHALMEEDLFGDGVVYYGCSCMRDRNYLLFTLTDESYTYEVVQY